MSPNWKAYDLAYCVFVIEQSNNGNHIIPILVIANCFEAAELRKYIYGNDCEAAKMSTSL